MKLGERNKRFDILVYNEAALPWMMIECKAMEVPLDKNVLWQILHYNIAIPVKYLVITNGRVCHAYMRTEQDFQAVDSLPTYSD